jgi:hypothetical protein
MALIDDLEELLSPEEFAKIKGNTAVATRITRGDELRSFYDGDEEPVVPAARVMPPANTGGQFDLGAVERMLDAKLGKINEVVDARVAEVVRTRGDELVNNAVRISIQRADELNRIYGRHEKETGKPFDSAEFNTFLEKPEVKAKGYRTITDAYNDYVAPQSMEREVDRRVAEELSAKSGQHVPGTTPAPATNSNIRVFMKRGTAASTGETTAVARAAALLDRQMAREQELAS